jgi:hypothetical protein
MGGMPPLPPPCVGSEGMFHIGTAGEEDAAPGAGFGAAGVGFDAAGVGFGASEAEIGAGRGGGSCGEVEPELSEEAAAAGLLRPSCFPPRDLPPLPPPRRRESTVRGGSMAGGSGA